MAKQFILIMTDTQRTDWLGCYGNPDMKTPNLDRMASEGIRFTKAYTCQPVCGPARSAIFTGTYPHENGTWGNSQALGDNVKTIGQRLRDQGIKTAYIGKWHLDGSDYFGLGRCPDGWDPEYWYDMRNYLEELSPEDRVRSRRPETSLEIDETFTYGHRCSKRAIDFLEKHSQEDFFLVISFDEPHGPFVCPPKYFEMYKDYEIPLDASAEDDLSNKPGHQKVWADLCKDTLGNPKKVPEPFKWFLGCNSFVDSEIGRIMEASRKHAPGALTVYTSDHGDHMGAHGLLNKGATMYEENIRIPMIVSWPGTAKAGIACNHPVSHIGLAPSIMDFFNLPAPKMHRGKSLLPCFRDPGVRIDDHVFSEFGRYEVDHDGFGGFQPIRCALDGRYKLVINLLTSDELYDLDHDPDEVENLIESGSHAEIRNRLHDRMLVWMNETRDPFRGYYWERRPWRKDAAPASWDHTAMTRQREEEERYEPRQLDYNTGLEMTDATRAK